MYITRVEIQNIRSIKHLVWEIDAADAPGWHVILGDNGSGKSTFIQTVAVTIVGLPDIIQLRESWEKWIPVDIVDARYEMFAEGEEEYHTSTSDSLDAKLVYARLSYLPNSALYPHEVKFSLIFGLVATPGNKPVISALPAYRRNDRGKDGDSSSYKWKLSQFHASYGAFRRFYGGDEQAKAIHTSSPLLARHISAFSHNIPLIEGLEWLKSIRFEELEGLSAASLLLVNIRTFLNQGDLLPYGAQLTEVTSAGVKFRDGNGSEILVEEMSDGYRSVLSLTFELLRQLSIAYGADIFETHDEGKVTVKVPGVVQIDEVDAHLHPTWQKRIGFWFREHFPQMQFIVTTHSPLVCQAAEKGSIFLLPRPGTDETGRMLEGAERDRLLYGDILDAYSTTAFGGGDTRSPKGQEMLDRLGELNVKELREGLTAKERKEQEQLRRAMPTSATTLPEMP